MSENPRGVIADIKALGCQMIIASQIREAELRAAGVERARAAIVLGDDDVMALRLGLMTDELAPGLRIVIEMTNPRLGGRLTSLIGDCTLLSSAELPRRPSWRPPSRRRILSRSRLPVVRSPRVRGTESAADHELAGNERIAVVATRAGLARLQRVTRATARANQA